MASEQGLLKIWVLVEYRPVVKPIMPERAQSKKPSPTTFLYECEKFFRLGYIPSSEALDEDSASYFVLLNIFVRCKMNKMESPMTTRYEVIFHFKIDAR